MESIQIVTKLRHFWGMKCALFVVLFWALSQCVKYYVNFMVRYRYFVADKFFKKKRSSYIASKIVCSLWRQKYKIYRSCILVHVKFFKQFSGFFYIKNFPSKKEKTQFQNVTCTETLSNKPRHVQTLHSAGNFTFRLAKDEL
jgi:hypothetical protein